MTDIQVLTFALPSVLSLIAVVVGIVINNSRLGDAITGITETRTDLRRLEEVIDARLKHLEER